MRAWTMRAAPRGQQLWCIDVRYVAMVAMCAVSSSAVCQALHDLEQACRAPRGRSFPDAAAICMLGAVPLGLQSPACHIMILHDQTANAQAITRSVLVFGLA